MSRAFWIALACIFAAYAVYETGINFYLRRLHDQAIEQCVRPAEAPLTRVPGTSA